MTLPGAWPVVEVRVGPYFGTSGEPLQGERVTFEPRVKRLRLLDDTIIVREKTTVTLDENGEGVTELPVSDDPDISTNGWTWQVREKFRWGQSYDIEVLTTDVAAGIDLSDRAPVVPDEAYETFRDAFRGEMEGLRDESEAAKNAAVEIAAGDLSTAAASAVDDVLGSGGAFIDARTNPTIARSSWPGPAVWIIDEGDSTPTNYPGAPDMVWEVATDPLPWTPTRLSGLIGWFSPRDSGVPDAATASGSVPNLSGLSAWAVTAGGAAYDADGLNGHPCFVFNGDDAFQTGALSTTTGNGAFTVICAVQLTSTAATGAISDGYEATLDFYASSTANGWSMRRGSTMSSMDVINTSVHYFFIEYAANGGTHSMSMDGTVIGTAASTSSTGASRWTLGRRRDGTAPLNGKIGDYLLIRGALSVDEKADAIAWIKARHGIA